MRLGLAFWRGYWITLRPYLFFVSGAAGMVGLGLAQLPTWIRLAGTAAFLLTYGLGQALTDTTQTDTDAISSPYRPLVRGEIDVKDVRAVSLTGLAACGVFFGVLNRGRCSSRRSRWSDSPPTRRSSDAGGAGRGGTRGSWRCCR